MLRMSCGITGGCMARQVATRRRTSAIAGTMVQAISPDRRGILTAESALPGIGERTAERTSAASATTQQTAAIQKTREATVGDIAET